MQILEDCNLTLLGGMFLLTSLFWMPKYVHFTIDTPLSFIFALGMSRESLKMDSFALKTAMSTLIDTYSIKMDNGPT